MATVIVKHLGEPLRIRDGGNRLTRENYAIPSKKVSFPVAREFVPAAAWERNAWRFDDDSGTVYSDDHVEKWLDFVLINYDINMRYFRDLEEWDHKFEGAVTNVVTTLPQFQHIVDIQDLHEVGGVYMMVLGNHRQVYVGQSKDIRKRIRQHWYRRKAFDRLIHGSLTSSILTIDAFRELDTTSIYAAECEDRDELEYQVVDDFPKQFLLNRMNGGKYDYWRAMGRDLEYYTREMGLDTGDV